jgi:hypothetical protein
MPQPPQVLVPPVAPSTAQRSMPSPPRPPQAAAPVPAPALASPESAPAKPKTFVTYRGRKIEVDE